MGEKTDDPWLVALNRAKAILTRNIPAVWTGIVVATLFLLFILLSGDNKPSHKVARRHSGGIESFSSELNQACLIKPARVRNLCWPTSSLIWHVRQFEVWRVAEWEQEYKGVIPTSVIFVPFKQIILGEVKDPSSAARWTLTTPPAPDGALHTLVHQFPCQISGCCAVPWSARPNSTDMFSLYRNLIDFEYSALLSIDVRPKYILDAGGVGMSAVAMSLLYPDALIIRVEPHPDNFRVGVRSSYQFSNIRHVQAALWDEVTLLEVCENNAEGYGKEWPFSTSRQLGYYMHGPKDRPCYRKASVDYRSHQPVANEVMPLRVQATTLDDLMKAFGIPHFDIVKMDIEGAEGKVFSRPATAKIMRDVKVFIGWLHDSSFPGSGLKVKRTFNRIGGFRALDDKGVSLFVREDMYSC